MNCEQISHRHIVYFVSRVEAHQHTIIKAVTKGLMGQWRRPLKKTYQAGRTVLTM